MPVPPKPWAIVPGNHDGVHRGHRQLIALAREQASELPVVPLFFDPHPAVVLRPEKAPVPLTTSERRVELLLAAGASHVVCHRFDLALSALSPRAFAEEFLKDKLGAELVVTGPDFRFGQHRAGHVGTLRDLGEKLGFRVCVADEARQGGERISSSWIREQITRGEVHEAAQALGRYHEAEAEVVVGQKRGRTIGFPTANLGALTTLLPSDGVYAVVARVTNDPQMTDVLIGAANLGQRPTLDAGRSLEVHLIDYEVSAEALYKKRLRIGFVARLRDEIRFDGLDALRRQIGVDVKNARTLAAAARMDREMMQWF